MTTLPLRELAQVKVAADGSATARIAPIGHGVIWRPQRVDIRTSDTAGGESICNLYVGDRVIPSNLIDTSYAGSSGDSSERMHNIEVRMGMSIWAVWSYAVPGSFATLTVIGVLEVMP